MAESDRAKRRFSKWLSIVVNLTALGVMAVALLHPKGLVVTTIRERRDRAAQRRTIAAMWDELAGKGGSEQSAAVIEFMDYQCPACRMAKDTVVAAQARAGIQVGIRHLPLPIHPAAEGAARAAICAEVQGWFDAMHERLMSTTAWQQDARWSEEAVAAGVPDTLRFVRCLHAEETEARLELDRRLAARLEIRSTPSFVSRAGTRRGLLSVADLLDLREFRQ